MSKILIGSPVKQKARVLKEFLIGLEEADKGGNQITYFFVDDNGGDESSDLLNEFAKKYDVILKKGTELFSVEEFGSDNIYNDHNWKAVNLAKVTTYKDTMIKYCVDKGFDYLMLIDSDVIIDKRTIPQLLSDKVEIVSNIYWNHWGKNTFLAPNCFWIPDIYVQEKEFCVSYDFSESHKRRLDAYEQLKIPGLHEVMGLGACTMIARSALEKGTRFEAIHNLEIPGEDRPFCIRAGVAGIHLYMDTVYPAYHCNEEVYLERLEEYKREGWKWDMRPTSEEKPAKKLNAVEKFIVRVCKKIVRDISGK